MFEDVEHLSPSLSHTNPTKDFDNGSQPLGRTPEEHYRKSVQDVEHKLTERFDEIRHATLQQAAIQHRAEQEYLGRGVSAAGKDQRHKTAHPVQQQPRAQEGSICSDVPQREQDRERLEWERWVRERRDFERCEPEEQVSREREELARRQGEELVRREKERRERERWERDARYRRAHEERSRQERERWHRETLARREREERERREREEREHREREEHEREERERRAREEHERREREKREPNEAPTRPQPASGADELQNVLDLYEAKWAELKTSQSLQGVVDFYEFPFPVLANYLTHPAGITYEHVRDFLFHPSRRGIEGKTYKEVLKTELLRWHPDKFDSLVSSKMREGHWPPTKEAAGLVARYVMQLLSETRSM